MNAEANEVASQTNGAATPKKKTEVTVVEMEDGTKVEFPGKRKMNKSHVIDEESGKVSIRLDFRNGMFRTIDLPQSLILKFAAHGAEQKYGDELAGLKGTDGGEPEYRRHGADDRRAGREHPKGSLVHPQGRRWSRRDFGPHQGPGQVRRQVRRASQGLSQGQGREVQDGFALGREAAEQVGPYHGLLREEDRGGEGCEGNEGRYFEGPRRLGCHGGRCRRLTLGFYAGRKQMKRGNPRRTGSPGELGLVSFVLRAESGAERPRFLTKEVEAGGGSC